MTPLKELLQQADQLKTSCHQDITITEDTIKELHRTVLTGGGTTPADSYRTGMPAIDDHGYQPPHPEDVPRPVSYTHLDVYKRQLSYSRLKTTTIRPRT